MTTVPSADNQDPTLYCQYFGGPRDGLKTGDLPAELSSQSLHGTVMRTPLSEPFVYSLFAVYECTSETQIDGFWRFEFQGFVGPNGETLVAEEPEALETQGLAEWNRSAPTAPTDIGCESSVGALKADTDALLAEVPE